MSGHTQRMAFCLVMVTAASLAGWARADVVVLNNGDIIQGKIVEEADDHIRVKVTSSIGITVTRTFLRDDIRSMKKGPVEPAKDAQGAETPAGQETKSEQEEADEDEEEDDGKRLPLEIDLRMALHEPLILDSFKDSIENRTPRGSGYFVLVPFQYEAAEEPYTITRYRVKFSADRGSARCRGIVALDDKESAGSRSGRGVRGARTQAPPQPGHSLTLTVAKDKPLYSKMTVFAVGDELRVVAKEVPHVSTDDDRTARSSNRRSSRSRGRSSRSTHRPSSARDRARRTTYGRSRTAARSNTEELRGYERRRYAADAADTEDEKDTADSTQPDAVDDLSTRERRLLDDSQPASGWAAFLVELANEAAVVTARVSDEEEVRIELRLIDTLTQKNSRGGSQQDDLQMIRTLSDYANHESPALAQLAIARLAELRSTDKTGRGAPDPAELDERTQLIELAMLKALTSESKRIRRTAWWELTSTDTLPPTTEKMILSSPPEVAEALLTRVAEEIADAAKASPAASDDQDRGRTLARRQPRRRAEKDEAGVAYTPKGLQESAAAPGVWAVLGALMRVDSEKVASQAVTLALKDGSRQAISLLGTPSSALASAALKALPKLPNTQAKQEAVKMLLAGFSAGGANPQLLSGLTGVVSAMARAGRSLVVVSPDDVIMQVVASLRDKPELQIEALRLLHWCHIGAALNSDGIDTWLTSMTDNLVAKDCQQATVILIATKWMPQSLRPLSTPGTIAPAEEDKPDAKAGRGRRPAPSRRGRGAAKPTATPDAKPDGPIETFLVSGLGKYPDPTVQVPVTMALLRAGRSDLIVSHHGKTGADQLATLIQQVAQRAAQYPPVIAPGQPTRFTAIDMAMAMVDAKEEPAVRNASATALAQVLTKSSSGAGWRTALSLKRRMEWKALASMCSAPDAAAAGAVRQALMAVLGLAAGERDAIAQAPDLGAIMGKLGDYDRQRGARIPGKYQAVVLVDVLFPNYRLEFDPKDAPKANERGAKIVDLTWRRQVLALEPGTVDISAADNGKIEVKLGSLVIGTGKLPSAKTDDKTPKKSAAAGNPQQDALQKRLAELRAAGPSKSGGKAGKAPESSFSIELTKLAQALYTSPALRGKIPMMAMMPSKLPAKAKAAIRGAGAALAADLLNCKMHHLAFGTRQGQANLGDGTPPKLDTMEVRVDKNGRIIRGAAVVPRVQTLQIFLEPVK